MSRARVMLVVLDGLADRRQPALGGRTPLEAASTPNLDALAAQAATGLMYPLGPGLSPSSHMAHFALFGYQAHEFPGRGYLEALGEGVPAGPDEIVCRASFLRAEERDGTFLIAERPDPRGGGLDLEPDALDAEIDGVRITYTHTGGLQGIVHLACDHRSLSHRVTDADPLRTGVPVTEVRPLEEAEHPGAAALTADVLNRWMLEARSRLAGRAYDFAVVKWAGTAAPLPTFAQRTGMRGASLGSGPLYAGIARAVGIEHVDPGESPDARADLTRSLALALELLDDGREFVHVHSKAPDGAGHRKDPELKRQVAEALDAAFGEFVARRAWGEDLVVCVTADHVTPSSGPLYHAGGPVPLLIAGGALGADEVSRFSERTCADGLLGRLYGTELMPTLLDAADRAAFLADRSTAVRCLGTPRAEDVPALRASRD